MPFVKNFGPLFRPMFNQQFNDGAGGGGLPEDFLVNYRMDGNDANLTRFGTQDFRQGRECPDGIGSQGNGVDQYWKGDPDSFIFGDIGGGAFTISVWFSTYGNTNRAIMATGTAGGTAGNDSIRYRVTGGGNYQFRINATNLQSTNNWDDGDIHHVTFVSTGSNGTFTFYVDGAFNSTGAMPSYTLVDTNNFWIGAQNGGTSTYDGLLDGFRVYDRPLTADEVLALYNYDCAFTPAQITTTAWYDARNSSSSNITTGGGSLVSQWADKSGNSNPMVQATGANQLDTGITYINGLNSLDNSLEKFMETQSNLSTIIDNTDQIIYAVANIGAVDNGADGIWGIAGGNQDADLRSQSAVQFDGQLNITGQTNVGAVGGPYSGPILTSCVFDKSVTGQKQIRINGAFNAQAPITTSFNNLSSLRALRGRQTATLRGSIGELLFVNSLSDLLEVEGYLAWKWFPTTSVGGSNPNLPAGHPYEFEPPKT